MLADDLAEILFSYPQFLYNDIIVLNFIDPHSFWLVNKSFGDKSYQFFHTRQMLFRSRSNLCSISGQKALYRGSRFSAFIDPFLHLVLLDG